jgi:hypothetical protein
MRDATVSCLSGCHSSLLFFSALLALEQRATVGRRIVGDQSSFHAPIRIGIYIRNLPRNALWKHKGDTPSGVKNPEGPHAHEFRSRPHCTFDSTTIRIAPVRS